MVQASNPVFWERVEQGKRANQKIVQELIQDLQAEGYQSIDAVLGMTQGYQSKLFHTLAHLLDGFFGIDSSFYNMEEDSHWVSESLQKQMSANPTPYWLIKVAAATKGQSPDRLPLLRSLSQKDIE